MVKYTIQSMRGVVEHYRAFRVQPPDCVNCKYLVLSDADEDVPEGFEEMRREHRYISQCPEHNKPEYQWLHKADLDTAARWLVKRGNRSKTGTLVFEKIMHELRKDLCV